MSRLPERALDRLNAAERALFETITAGKRSAARGGKPFVTAGGGLPGPFNALLYAPHVGDAAQRLGERLRFEGNLPPRQREIAVLCVAAHWRARYEWWAHARIARECGVPDAVIDAIGRRERPPLSDPAEILVHDYSRALLEQRQISDDLYRDGAAALGETSLVELVVLLGYYSLVSMLLVSFEIPIPDGESTPFDK